jgi:predicted O-linked N-acetylglucosamine transferase (SPINDLY family)
VAIVSPDLFDHSVAYFVRPVLEHRDPGAVEYFCFHTGPMQDWMSRHLRAASAGWRDMSRANDAQLLEAVRRDQPDIVLELAGHTNNSRLIALRWRGGPVQATAIGYPNTTGVPTIDYRLVDSLTDPPGPADALATEKLVRLDPCFLCYSPPAPDHTPPPVAPPSVRNGFITFGSFNSINKVTPGTVSLWASVLRGVPRSRLLVKTGGLSAQSARHHLAGLLAGAGVPADRFDLMERVRDKRDHLETYNRIDISLDTSPYNGTTTTCESLFMGVPVVSLATTLHAGRVGLSVLTAAGHPGLVARSPEQFLRIAVSLASDGPRLADLRSGLRAGLAASALCDGPAYARRFEAALRGMWGAYCAGHTGGPR